MVNNGVLFFLFLLVAFLDKKQQNNNNLKNDSVQRSVALACSTASKVLLTYFSISFFVRKIMLINAYIFLTYFLIQLRQIN